MTVIKGKVFKQPVARKIVVEGQYYSSLALDFVPYSCQVYRQTRLASENLRPLTEPEKALVAANVKFAYYIAKRMPILLSMYNDADDGFQQALLGMMHAATLYRADKINPKTGKSYSFLSFSGHWIRAYLFRGVYLNNRTSNAASLEELLMGKAGNGDAFSSVVAYEEKPSSAAEDREKAEAALRKLPQREQRVIRLVAEFGLISAAASVLGISRERCRQIYRRAQNRVRGESYDASTADINRRRYTDKQVEAGAIKGRVSSLRPHLLNRRHAG